MRIDKCLTFVCTAIVIFAASTVVAHAQAIEDGLAGYWTFDDGDINGDTAVDALGEHDGEIKGKPQVVEGIVGDALSFNGKEDYVVMGAAT